MGGGIPRVKQHYTDKNHDVGIPINNGIKERSKVCRPPAKASNPSIHHVKQVGEDHKKPRRKKPAVAVQESASDINEQPDKRQRVRVDPASSQPPDNCVNDSLASRANCFTYH